MKEREGTGAALQPAAPPRACAPAPPRGATPTVEGEDRDAVMRSVVHDLRTPLNGIMLAASALEARVRAGTAVDPLPVLSAIQREAMRMDRLIDDLLDVTRLDAGRLSLRLDALRPSDLADDLIDAFPSDALDVALVVSAGDGLPRVRADRPRVRRVFANLLDNAIRYSEPGGIIEVEVAQTEGGVRFAVIDHGSGVPPGERDHLFEPFWRGHRARGSGSGLGLSIARDIVEAHGGSIGFRETPGGGSTFCFTLPLADGHV